MDNSDYTMPINYSCLPPELDQKDMPACRAFFPTATTEQQWAIISLQLTATTNALIGYHAAQEELRTRRMIGRVIDECRELAMKGGPLPPQLTFNGKAYPDGMPKEHQRLRTFDDVVALPEEHLHSWLTFEESRVRADTRSNFSLKFEEESDHFKKCDMLYMLLGGPKIGEQEYKLALQEKNRREEEKVKERERTQENKRKMPMPDEGEPEPVNGTEAQAANGTEAQRANGTEAQAANGTEAQAANGTEAQAANGTEAQAANGTEAQAANGTEAQGDGIANGGNRRTKRVRRARSFL